MGVVETVDVRTHQSNVMLARNFDDSLLQFVLANFRKSGWDQDRTRDFLIAHFLEHLGDVYHGLCQQFERMDIVARSLMAKGCLSLGALAALTFPAI